MDCGPGCFPRGFVTSAFLVQFTPLRVIANQVERGCGFQCHEPKQTNKQTNNNNNDNNSNDNNKATLTKPSRDGGGWTAQYCHTECAAEYQNHLLHAISVFCSRWRSNKHKEQKDCIHNGHVTQSWTRTSIVRGRMAPLPRLSPHGILPFST